MRFEEGKTLYFLYRLLCGNTHAGIQIAEQWLEADARLSFHVRETPHPQNAMRFPPECGGIHNED